MAYTAKDYSKLIGMEGFSETLFKNINWSAVETRLK